MIARFITKDSYEGDIANPLSINQYSYCYNNPLIYVDPSGHLVDQAGLQQMYERGEIDNYTITYVPGAGDTATVTQGGSTLTITDNDDEYFDYTERVHDLMGFGNTIISSSNPSNTYEDNVSSKACPTTGNKEIKKVKRIVERIPQEYHDKPKEYKNIKTLDWNEAEWRSGDYINGFVDAMNNSGISFLYPQFGLFVNIVSNGIETVENKDYRCSMGDIEETTTTITGATVRQVTNYYRGDTKELYYVKKWPEFDIPAGSLFKIRE